MLAKMKWAWFMIPAYQDFDLQWGQIWKNLRLLIVTDSSVCDSTQMLKLDVYGKTDVQIETTVKPWHNR